VKLVQIQVVFHLKQTFDQDCTNATYPCLVPGIEGTQHLKILRDTFFNLTFESICLLFSSLIPEAKMICAGEGEGGAVVSSRTKDSFSKGPS